MAVTGSRRGEFADIERRIYALISSHEGLKARDIADSLGLTRKDVNRELYQSPLMRELCYQDSASRWHAVVRSAFPHEGLWEFSGWYGLIREFLVLSEEEWMASMMEGCRRIGRNLNDTRGLFHSFRDCRQTILTLCGDLSSMTDGSFADWELVFEFRLNRGRRIRIYADVLIITRQKVFSLEFKMKDTVVAAEVLQAAKYVPYLEIVFGGHYDILPALVLTAASDYFDFVPIGSSEALLPVCSGDMLFNVLNEYLGFLSP